MQGQTVARPLETTHFRANAEFRLGEIEHLPVESNSVDYVISNCVINLSPDKLAVFKESFRVLKEGGVFAVADVTLQKEIPDSARKDMDSWSVCISGALVDTDYERLLMTTGFRDIQIEHVSDSNIGEHPFACFSSHIKARKLTVGSLQAPRPFSQSRS